MGDKVARKEFAVIDFGSSKIVLLVGFKTKDGIHMIAKCETEYDGFMEGEFLEPEKLSEIVSHLVSDAEKASARRITKIYVGIPDEFLVPLMQENEILFRKPTKIKEKHLTQLLEFSDLSFVPDTHEIVSVVPVSYSLDDSYAILEIDNQRASKVTAQLSVIVAEKQYLELMQNVMTSVGIAHLEYLPTCLASSHALIDTVNQQSGSVLIDVGNITTSIATVFNGGIVELKTFTSGGGLINSDLMSMLKINYYEAEQLKRKTVLSVEPTKDDYYEIYKDNKLVKFYSQTVNDIVKARVENIADNLLSCFKSFESGIDEDTKVYLTGGGLGYIVGGVEILSDILEHKVELVCPKELQYFRPDYASCMALLNMAIELGE